MQTALHIAALVDQLRTEVIDGVLVATHFYKKQRAAYFLVKNNHSRVAVGFVYHPAGSGCFCVPASKIKIDTKEKPWPIFGLDGAKIIEVVQPTLDRVFELVVQQDGVIKRVVFEILGPNGNLWLLDEAGTRQATLRNRKFISGELYKSSPMVDRVNPHEITGEAIHLQLETSSGTSPLARLKKLLIGFNDTMIREVLGRSAVGASELREPTATCCEKLANSIKEIAGRFNETQTGYLYEIRGNAEAYPFKLVSVDTSPTKFKTLSLATLEMVAHQRSTTSEADEEKLVLRAVERAVKRKQRLVKNLNKDVEQAAGYERYKRYGELLQLERSRLKKGMTEIEIEDILSDEPDSIRIKLDPAISPNDNIEAYFRRHRKGREGLDLLKRRLAIAGEELVALQKIQSDLETNFESAHQEYQAEIMALLPGNTGKRETPQRLPYRPATLSTGLTIFIGRDGTDNDRTTFEFARPYELWFHTQQCPGSHVVMKFPNKSFEPSKREIEETAAIAAFHSKARKNNLVPVIYAQRKYVRKPRKAKPGLVTVEREKSVMVAPRKEE